MNREIKFRGKKFGEYQEWVTGYYIIIILDEGIDWVKIGRQTFKK